MPDTDGQLYIRFLNENDEEAFNCLFDRYNEGLMLLLYVQKCYKQLIFAL